MDRRCYRALSIAAVCALAVFPATASAQSTSDLVDWNLTESASTWGTQFHIGTAGSVVEYRWVDSPNKATVISGNACSDLAFYGSYTFGVGDTNYHTLFSDDPGTCFAVRGRTTSGSGSMVNHEGRVSR
jgi:hypothetical protein